MLRRLLPRICRVMLPWVGGIFLGVSAALFGVRWLLDPYSPFIDSPFIDFDILSNEESWHRVLDNQCDPSLWFIAGIVVVILCIVDTFITFRRRTRTHPPAV